jgi:hypothetical protein
MSASIGSTMGVMSTRSLRQPSPSTMRSASASESGDEARYGMRMASSLSGPMARAHR